MSRWRSEPPTRCGVCGRPLGETFVAGRNVMGMWGIFCEICHAIYGEGLGGDRGQRFDRRTLRKLYRSFKEEIR